jgi:hypothetical protein
MASFGSTPLLWLGYDTIAGNGFEPIPTALGTPVANPDGAGSCASFKEIDGTIRILTANCDFTFYFICAVSGSACPAYELLPGGEGGSVSGNVADGEHVFGNPSPEVIYRLQGTGAVLSLDTCGSSFGTTIRVFDGCPITGTEIATAVGGNTPFDVSDRRRLQACDNGAQLTNVPTQLGRTYFVLVECRDTGRGAPCGTGQFQLNFNLPDPATGGGGGGGGGGVVTDAESSSLAMTPSAVGAIVAGVLVGLFALVAIALGVWKRQQVASCLAGAFNSKGGSGDGGSCLERTRRFFGCGSPEAAEEPPPVELEEEQSFVEDIRKILSSLRPGQRHGRSQRRCSSSSQMMINNN